MTTKDSKNRTIVLPIASGIYERFMLESKFAHETIKELYESHMDLFPAEMLSGYKLNGRTRLSKKIEGFQMRKIMVAGTNYQIRPSYILPYCREQVDLASKGLFLLKFGVPFWALAFVFGYNATWWYRMFISLERHDIVGTTIYDAKDLPEHIIADENHIKVRGAKKYVATTVGANCFLGMSVCDNAGEQGLRDGYGTFKQESQSLKAGYEPISVNTDGWAATQKAWKSLFASIQVVECFLHAFLKVRDRATRKMESFFNMAGDKIWNIYESNTKREMAQRIRRLKEWASECIINCPMKANILKLCAKKDKWMRHIDNPDAHRTSNMLDRLMRAMKKHKVNSQMFHSTTEATTKNFRAFALIYNFTPSCPSVWKKKPVLKSPAERLNKRKYADDWLENLLLSAKKHQFRQHSKV